MPDRSSNPDSNRSLFVSYSHADEVWKDRLLKHLAVALSDETGEPLAEVWDDRRIRLGDEWLQAIERALDRAHAAILLVSVDFLASDFIRRVEVRRLLQRRQDDGVRVFPLLLRQCPWRRQSWLAKLQMHPKDATPLEQSEFPDEALAAFADAVATSLEVPRAPAAVDLDGSRINENTALHKIISETVTFIVTFFDKPGALHHIMNAARDLDSDLEVQAIKTLPVGGEQVGRVQLSFPGSHGDARTRTAMAENLRKLPGVLHVDESRTRALGQF